MGQKVEIYNASNSRKPTVCVGTAAQGSDNQLYLISINEATGALKTETTVSISNKTPVFKTYLDYSVTNVTTAAFVQLIASTVSVCTEIEIFDSSGQLLRLAIGAAAAETDLLYVFPGGNGRVPCVINASSRISIRAVTATANVGFIAINFYN